MFVGIYDKKDLEFVISYLHERAAHNRNLATYYSGKAETLNTVQYLTGKADAFEQAEKIVRYMFVKNKRPQ